MVLGTPGSGKTTLIVALVRILVQMKQRVLVVSFTNQALDDALLRLQASGFKDFIRITNNITSTHVDIQGYVKNTYDFDSFKQIKQTIDDNYVYGATCL